MVKRVKTGVRSATESELLRMAQDIKANMLMRVPRASGELANSIRINASAVKEGRVIVKATARHARAQEYGFKPHYINMARMRNSKRRGYIGGPGEPTLYGLRYKPGLARVGAYHPFMRPAYEAMQQKLPHVVKRIAAMAKA